LLAADLVNLPLLNRATQAQYPPGSTAKPIVGMGAISMGVLGPDEGIECTGYLFAHGHYLADSARCWTASYYQKFPLDPSVAHHPMPFPHQGIRGNRDGFLTYDDALERSCNVFFETVGERLGLSGLRSWFDRFGLGRPTGIGIPESSGRIPPDSALGMPRWRADASKWFSSIGQADVVATPIQMANVAATVARRGTWMRPLLLDDQPRSNSDRVDLGLNPRAVELTIDGMTRVVNSRAGSGTELRRADLLVAGKTGTAQAAEFSVPVRGPDGKFVRDADGRVQREFLRIGTRQNPNPLAPWYIANPQHETDLNHAWYIGFAPADDPRIAFAVLVEYGGSGGKTAAYIARELLEACIRHGYLELAPARQPN
jgi:penicillin-binding protein 2